MTTVGPNAPGAPVTTLSGPSQMVDATVGQEGSPAAGTPLPGPNDPGHQLSIIAGLMAGDKYNVAQPQLPDLTMEGLTNRSLDNYASSFQASEPFQPPQVNQPTQGGQGVLAAARKYLGIPYVYGATGPNAYDCSGFVQKVYKDMGIALPRVTYDQVNAGRAVLNSSQLQPGDLLFFWGDGNRRNGHVGIFMGGNQMIDEPHTGSSVGYRQIDWNQVTAMRRVLP